MERPAGMPEYPLSREEALRLHARRREILRDMSWMELGVAWRDFSRFAELTRARAELARIGRRLDCPAGRAMGRGFP